jgi:hypothetical protein
MMVNRYDVIARAVAQMLDLSTSHVLLDMHQPKVSRLVIRLNSVNRGEIVPVVIKNIRTSLDLTSHPSLFRSYEGSIHKTHEGRWNLFTRS